MKRVINDKTKQKQVVFNTYELNGATACPECHRPFKEFDYKSLEERGTISCLKCGAKLKK